jgi:hypothetical protein
MTNTEIFRQAREAADDAVQYQFGATGPSASPTPTNGAGEYWTLVYTATVAALLKHNGSY